MSSKKKKRVTERKRQKLSQSLHDWVIEKTVEKLYGKIKKAGNQIHTNPNRIRKYDVNGFYPDIVVYNPKKKKVTVIGEIETVVGEIEKNQWEDFANLGVSHFSVTIPLSEVKKAKKIIKENKIAVKSMWSYQTTYPKVKTIEFKKETLPSQIC